MRRLKQWLLLCLLLAALTVRGQAMEVHIRVAFNSNLPPFQFLDEDNNAAGMHVDILNVIAKKHGYTVEYIPYRTTLDCVAALEQANVDMVMGYMMSENVPEDAWLSNELSSSSLCLVVPNRLMKRDADGFVAKGLTSVYEYGTASYSIISRMKAESYLAVGNQVEVYQSFLEGKVDTMIGIKDSLLYQIYSDNRKNDFTVANNYMANIRYAFMLPAGDYELRRNLNNGLAQLRSDGTYGNIREDWTIDTSEYDRTEMLRNITSAATICGCLLGAYVVVNQRIKRLLKRQVEEQTKKIQQTNLELTRRLEQLQEVSDLQKRILENSTSGIFLLDSQYVLGFVNSAGLAMAELNGKKVGVSALQVPFLQQIIQALHTDLFQGEHSRSNQMVTVYPAGDEPRTYRCAIHQTIEFGEVTGALLTIADVTQEEKQKQEEFEQEKNKALNRMIAGIAHEIKNPLTSIQTFATLIGTRQGDLQVQQKFAEFVPKEIERICRLIEGLIHYAKPAKSVPEPVDMASLVQDCLYLTQPVVKKGTIQVETHLEEGLYIWADKTQMKQVLVNIIMNSVESMEEKLATRPEAAPLLLQISGFLAEDCVVLQLLDQGCGMSEKQRKRCTDPFFSTKAKGTGMGLSLSDHFITNNNGSLSIESEEQAFTQITIRFRRYRP